MAMSSSGQIPVEALKPLSVASFKITPKELDYLSLSFCQRYSLEERKTMAERVRVAQPGFVGVVLHLSKSALKELRSHLVDPQRPYVRIMVSPDVQMSEFIVHARRMFSKELPEVAGLFLYLCDGSVERIVSLQARFTEYRERARGEDGLVHFMVTVEAVFGGSCSAARISNNQRCRGKEGIV